MANYLEWSRAYSGRLVNAEKCQSRAPELADKLATGLAAGQMPFLSMGYRSRLDEDMARVLPQIAGFRYMLLLGIGGSALGARALQRAFAPGQNGPDYDGKSLWIADNVGPAQFEALLGSLDPARTIVVCISKSGGTIETIAQYFLVRDWLEKGLGEKWREHMVLVTDARNGYLRQEAGSRGLASMEVPDYLGGRYSALSAVGLLPAAFLGIDWKGLLAGAQGVAAPLLDNPASLASHPAFSLACWARALQLAEYDELIFFCYIPQWATFGPWFAQLWAESLGKDGQGSMPIPAVGVTDQHSVNQMFLDGPRNKGCIFLTSGQQPAGPRFGDDLPEKWAWLAGKPFGLLLEAEALGTRMALCRSGVPLVQMDMGRLDERAAGAMMFLLEAATVFTGWLMGINPLDQPAVELGKRLANARLGAAGLEQESADLTDFLAQDPVMEEF